MSSKRACKSLPLQKKLEVIEEHEEKKLSVKALVSKFRVGKTQIYDILRNKDKIRNEWLKGTSGKAKRKRRITENEAINNAVYEWVVSARAKRMHISGPLIQTKALEVAKTVGNVNFKASNGWLESFKSRHNIVFKRVGANNAGVQKVMEVNVNVDSESEQEESEDSDSGSDSDSDSLQVEPTSGGWIEGFKSRDRIVLDLVRGVAEMQKVVEHNANVGSDPDAEHELWKACVSHRAEHIPDGWIEVFKSRNKIVLNRMYGDISELDVEDNANIDGDVEDNANIDGDVEDNANIDSELVTVDEEWTESLDSENNTDDEEEEEEGSEDKVDYLPEQKISSYKNALFHLNDLEEFAASRYDTDMVGHVRDVKTHVLPNVVAEIYYEGRNE